MPLAGLLVAVLAVAAPAPVGTPAPAKATLPGEPAELKAVDGWALKAMFAPSQPGRLSLVLLHGTGQRKEDWRRLAGPLVRAGYGVLALDLRGHGESRVTPAGETITWKKLRVTPAANDFADMARDAEAAVAWLAGQGVPEDTIGFIGAEVGGSVAIRYAATHPRVPLVVMLSPGMRWQEVLTVNALRALKRPNPMPLLMVWSEADKRCSKEGPLLQAFAKTAVGERHAAIIVVPQERGTRLFRAQRALVGQIIDWLAHPVPSAPPSDSTGAPTGVGAPPGVPSRLGAPDDSAERTLLDDTGTPAPAVRPAEDDED